MMKKLSAFSLILGVLAFAGIVLKVFHVSFPYSDYLIWFAVIVMIVAVVSYKNILPNTLHNENIRMYGVLSVTLCAVVILGEILLKFEN